MKMFSIDPIFDNVFDRYGEFFRKVLNAAGKIVAPGVTTEEIDALVGFHLISTLFHVFFSCSCFFHVLSFFMFLLSRSEKWLSVKVPTLHH